jgi:hypothetical protein
VKPKGDVFHPFVRLFFVQLLKNHNSLLPDVRQKTARGLGCIFDNALAVTYHPPSLI